MRTSVHILFCVCLFLCAADLLKLQTGPIPDESDRGIAKTNPLRTSPPGHSKAKKPTEGPGRAQPPDRTPPPAVTTTVTDDDLDYIEARGLLIPVANVTARQLRDTFNQARGEARRHDAIDIMAPQGTPVLAATDGTVIKLFRSDMGGITLYQLDPSRRYVYYYAHLMGYAEGIAEGSRLRRGDVIAYVGNTGNAGAGKYHLHFSISKLRSPHQWSGGDPINPYPFLVRN